FLARAVVVVCIVMMPLRVWQLAAEARTHNSDMAHERARVVSELNTIPGLHLIFVSYKPGHDTRAEWVYNAADIDSAKIVWARDMGRAQNEELVRNFSYRKIWILQVDDGSARLLPFLEEKTSHPESN